MDPSPQWRSLILAAVILAAFLAAVSMNLQRFQGWSFIILCILAALLGGAGYAWARDRVLPAWERLPKSRRVFLVALTAGIVLVVRFIANRHRPNEQFADLLACIGLLVALGMLGLYRVVSHLLGSFHARISRR